MSQPQAPTFRRVITVVMMAAIAYLGMKVFPLALCLVPAILLIQAFGDQWQLAFFSAIAMLIVLGQSFGLNYAIGFGLLLLPVTVWLYFSIKKPFHGNTIFHVAVIITIASVIVWMIFSVGGVENLDLKATFDERLMSYRDMLVSGGIAEGEIEDTMATLQAGIDALLMYLPSMILIYAVALPYVTLFFAGRTLLKRGVIIFQPPSFFLFRLPPNILFGIFIVFLFFIFGESLLGSQALAVQVNAIAFFGFLFLVNGLAVFHFYLSSRGMGSFLKGLILILCIVVPFINFFTIIIGMVDNIINFRKL